MITPDEPTKDATPADRQALRADDLVARFRGVPASDPDRLREDVDAVVDQRLPPNDDTAG